MNEADRGFMPGLQESVRQFGAPLREQLDLQAEARNLRRFNTNFRSWKRLSFPRPIFPLVAPDVLVRPPCLHRHVPAVASLGWASGGRASRPSPWGVHGMMLCISLWSACERSVTRSRRLSGFRVRV